MTLRINGLHIISISDCLSAPVVVGEVTPSTLLMYGMYVHCMLMVVLQFCSLFCILHCCTVHSSFGRFAWVCRWCTMHHWMRSEKKKKKKNHQYAILSIQAGAGNAANSCYWRSSKVHSHTRQRH